MEALLGRLEIVESALSIQGSDGQPRSLTQSFIDLESWTRPLLNRPPLTVEIVELLIDAKLTHAPILAGHQTFASGDWKHCVRGGRAGLHAAGHRVWSFNTFSNLLLHSTIAQNNSFDDSFVCCVGVLALVSDHFSCSFLSSILVDSLG